MRISVIPLALAMAGCAGGGTKHSQQGQDAGQADGVTQPEGGGGGDSAATPSPAALMTGVQEIHVGNDGPVWDP